MRILHKIEEEREEKKKEIAPRKDKIQKEEE